MKDKEIITPPDKEKEKQSQSREKKIGQNYLMFFLAGFIAHALILSLNG